MPIKLLTTTLFTALAGYISFTSFELPGVRHTISLIIFLAVGFFILIKGGDYLVNGASSVARTYNIPPLVIGLTVLAFGTSAPELFINLVAAVQGQTDLLLSNIIGSNMSNLLLIGGTAACIGTLQVKDSTLYKEIPFSLFAVLLLLILVNDTIIDGMPAVLSQADGFVLLLTFTIFLYYIISLFTSASTEQLDYVKQYSRVKSIRMLLVGIAGLYIGGELIVDNAVQLAEMLDVSHILIGSSILAIGSSIPELATAVIAALKKQTDMAVGNIIGSNIFNIFWIAGISSVVQPIPVNTALNVDIFLLITATLFFFTGIYSHKERSLTRVHGIIFLIMYVGYLGFLLRRG